MSEIPSNELPPNERMPPPPPRAPEPSWGWEDEKEEEKTAEKEAEKTDEKSGYSDEKVSEKYRRDPLGGVFFAAILIWVGLVFLADNLGLLPDFGNLGVWQWIPMGIGGLLIIEAIVRSVSVEYRRNVVGRLIFGGALLLWGLSEGVGLSWRTIWPALLILIGAVMLLRVFFWRRH